MATRLEHEEIVVDRGICGVRNGKPYRANAVRARPPSFRRRTNGYDIDGGVEPNNVRGIFIGRRRIIDKGRRNVLCNKRSNVVCRVRSYP